VNYLIAIATMGDIACLASKLGGVPHEETRAIDSFTCSYFRVILELSETLEFL
jgi:hypothetical protein